MNTKGPTASHEIQKYVAAATLRMPAALPALMDATQKTDAPMMATTPAQGQFIAFLIKSMSATRAIEVGVFTGQGTMWMAEAVGPAGRVVACDVSEDYTAIGRPAWQEAGLEGRIDLRIAPAAVTLQAMIDEGQSGTFDFCYIDADKEGYDIYYELVLPLLREGGVIAFDNMLQAGRVTDETNTSPNVVAIRALNRKLQSDDRVDTAFAPMFDGLHLARKR